MSETEQTIDELAAATKDRLMAEGAEAVTARISAINALPHAGHEALIIKCLADSSCSVEQAEKRLAAAKIEAAEARNKELAAQLEAAEAKNKELAARPGLNTIPHDVGDGTPSGGAEWDGNAELQAEFRGNKKAWEAYAAARAAGLINNPANAKHFGEFNKQTRAH